MKKLLALGLLALALTAAPAGAQQDPQAIVDSLNYKSGEIPLGDNLARLTLTPAFRFLDAADTRKLLVDLWGNPPQVADGRMGAIVPAGVSPLTNASWALLISYEESGHVTDDDAAGIDYDDLLKEMQESIREESKERVKQGYDPYELVAWAAPPHYDSQAKKLYWAQQLKFGDAPADSLNYEVRVLGRTGVLDLNIIASMDQLPMLNQRISEILGTVAFNPGNRYEEFDASSDHVAEYGIAGLIAGGVLAKAGFFKVLLVALAAGWKFVLAGLVIVGAVITKFLRRGTKAEG